MREFQEDEARLISEIHSRGMRDSGPKLRWKIQGNYKEKFLL